MNTKKAEQGSNGHAQTTSAPDLANMPSLTNLTEALAPSVEVRFVEWKSSPLRGEDGQPLSLIPGENDEAVMYREPYARIARISTFVPMRVFNLLLSSRDKLTGLGSLQIAVDEGENVDQNQDFSPMTEWMREMVLAIWQQSEPQMTRARFDDGLEFEQVFELFRVFFARLLKRWQEKAAFGATVRNPRG